MTTFRIARDMIRHARDYVVVNDGGSCYPVLRARLLGDETEASLRAMSCDEYTEWCRAVPADERVALAGDRRLTRLTDILVDHGADYWYIG